ncbi:pyrimidine utilization regulatory protein R [Marinibacterium anthonyi]|nr:pyrimidine utilization regulatory protein R [Marinibacterium anthonyi]
MPTHDTKPRNRQQTKDRILTALQAILLRDGFNGVSITSVAHEAGVDKVLIYRYFGRIDDLLTAFGQHADFWPSVDEVLSPDNDILAPAERLASFFNRFVEALRARPMTIEILAMEIGAPNPLTAALDATREAWGREVADRLAVGLDMPHRRLATIVTLLVCGIQFLGLRARATDTFGGIRIGSATGWQTIRADLAWLCDALLSDLPPHPTQPG